MNRAYKILRVVILSLGIAWVLMWATSGLASEKWTFETARTAAAGGNPKAEYYLAEIYADGNGVTQDYSKAMDYALKSAEQGYAPAETALGSFYAHGLGVKSDLSGRSNGIAKPLPRKSRWLNIAWVTPTDTAKARWKTRNRLLNGGNYPRSKVRSSRKMPWDNFISMAWGHETPISIMWRQPSGCSKPRNRTISEP